MKPIDTHCRALLRRWGWPLLVLFGSCFWLGATAHAAGSEWLMDTGASLLSYTRVRHLDAPRTVQLNGAALHVVSGSTDDPLSVVLDTFHARCRARSGQGAFEPVLRAQSGARGYLGCLDPTGHGLSPTEWLTRLQAFVRSGDLAVLGDLRFVWAMREGAQTSYVALWSEGSLVLRELFPTRGDAPGIDAPGLPRPPASRRLLSAFVEGAEPLLVSYRSEVAPARIEAQYRATLIDGGFAVRPLRVGQSAPSQARALSVEHQRTRARALVVVGESGAGGSSITLLPLP